MPLKGFTVTKKFGDSKKRILFKDCMVCLDETFKDEKVKYPAQTFVEFANYLQNKYHSGVFGEVWQSENDGTSWLKMVCYVPTEVKNKVVKEDIMNYDNANPNVDIIIEKLPQSGKGAYNTLPTYKALYEMSKNRDPNGDSDTPLDTAIKLFRLNWNAEPDLNDPDDQEELLLLYNMEQESYHGWYPVDIRMKFKTDIFSPKYEDRDYINLDRFYIHDSKENKEDSKMKKDADPRLELVEKIKMKEHPDYKDGKYDPNDDFVVYADYQFKSYSKEGLLKSDWVAADLSEDGYTSEEAMKWDNQKIVNYLQNIIDNDPYSASVQGLVDLNTIDGLKRILKRAWDWNGEDNLTEDSKQEQICDSFSKRYNK